MLTGGGMKDVAPAGHGDFAGPAGVILLKVDPITGGLPDRTCPQTRYEAFIEGTEPQDKCEEIRSETPSSDIAIDTF